MNTAHRQITLVLISFFLSAFPLFAFAQDISPTPDPVDLATKDPTFVLDMMVKKFGWTEPAAPMKAVGPIYFVGTKGLSAWLIKTSDGDILLNTAMPGSGPMIEASIRKLGFKPETLKLILTCHAHIDHVGGHAYLKKLAGAQVVMLDKEVDLFRSGGKADFNYGKIPAFAFESVKVDRIIHDGDTVTLGDVSLKALHTPGHTRGSTTWVTDVSEGRKRYKVVFPDGTGVNPGYRLVKNPSYPGIADDYRKTFHILEGLTPDIWLGSYTDTLKIDSRRAHTPKEGARAWMDRQGYKEWIASERGKFDAILQKETEAK